MPWEIWDYTATSPLVLADLTIGGRLRKVIMQAPKNGFLYVLDRETGQFISAKPYVFQNWALGHDSAGRPIINPKAIYEKGPAVVFPTLAGAHNWHPMSFNARTGLVYLGARHQGMIIGNVPEYRWKRGDWNVGSVAWFSDWLNLGSADERAAFERVLKANPGLPGTDTQESLVAWDPVAQQERWRVPVSTTTYGIGGVLSTAGNLVIHGAWDGRIIVYRADTGEQLKVIETGTGIMAAPMSYEIDGVQYIAVFAGSASYFERGAAGYRYQNYGRILALKLDGGETPLPPVRKAQRTPEVPAGLVYPDSLADRGAGLFFTYCSGCHWAKGEARLSAHPDLHRLSAATHADFDTIVLGGKLASVGMASCADILPPAKVRAIHAYLVREQGRLVAAEKQ